jgi:hypothetical protein
MVNFKVIQVTWKKYCLPFIFLGFRYSLVSFFEGDGKVYLQICHRSLARLLRPIVLGVRLIFSNPKP